MKVVVYPHRMEIGGSQLNAIELAGAVRDLGHEVIVFSQPGSLVQRVSELGLEFVAAPKPRGRPSPYVTRALRKLVADRGVDVVHGWEWTTAMEAYWGPRARLGVPAVATVMSQAVAPFLPFDMPLAVGTAQMVDWERRAGRQDVALIEPPVDTRLNHPGVADADAFRAEYDLDPSATTVVVVTRLAAALKLEGILTAIDTAPDLAPMQLVVVGDGPHRATVEEHAAAANQRAGRRVVVLTGELKDPRPAYDAADVCLGMGGSALRAMAFGKPLVVQGEQGYWQTLTPETVEDFLWVGWYGIGSGPEAGPAALRDAIEDLLVDPARQADLGAYAQQLVEDRFSLTATAERQVEIYEKAIAAGPLPKHPWRTAPGRASVVRNAAYRFNERVDQVLRRESEGDFNAKPVAAIAPRKAGEPV